MVKFSVYLNRRVFVMCFILADCSVSGTVPAGYDVSGTTTYGGSPVVTCANGYSGTAAAITCQADGTWTAFSGCTSNGGM